MGVVDAADVQPAVTELLSVVSSLDADAPAEDHAEAVGLRYVTVDDLGIRRTRRGRGFSYVRPDGSTVQGDERGRIETLAIPPAWQDVRICAEAEGHVRAVGIDGAGRTQYLYHPRWRSVRDATKFHRLAAFARALPSLRERVDADLRRRDLDRRRVLGLVVALLDATLLRVGNERYADDNGSRGLTTMLGEHVDVSSTRIHFSFPGKGGQPQDLELTSRRLAGNLLRCEEIPGQRLFAYRDESGWREVDSGQVNDYLREIGGGALTAKDFRTWGATVTVAGHLHERGHDDERPDGDEHDVDAAVLAAIDVAAERLGNTRAVARDSYVDPRVVEAYRDDELDAAWDAEHGDVGRLSPAERAVRRIVER